MSAPRAMFFAPIQLLASTRCASRASISLLKSVNVGSRITLQSRFVSKSPPRNPKTSPPQKSAPLNKAGTKDTAQSKPPKIKVTSAAKVTANVTPEAKITSEAEAAAERKRQALRDRFIPLEPADLQAVIRSLDIPRLMHERTKLLWPGIWTVSAVAFTYGVFAYMDANYGDAISSAALQTDRPETSDSWFLTPTVIKDGIKTAWQDLDKLTVGIIGFSAALHAMRRSGLFSLVNLVHVSGKHQYTVFTNIFIYKNWFHLGRTSLMLAWFLPGLVRHFDGDIYHTAAFLLSVSVIMPYVHHFEYRFLHVQSIPALRGTAYLCVTVFGAYCVAYPHEKTWTPAGVVLRLPSEYWGFLYVVSLTLLNLVPKNNFGVKAFPFVYGLGHFGLGAAYVYFDGKNKIWKPLVERFSTPALISSL